MAQSHRAPLAVITGGSEGIGLALAHEFGRHGYDLLICAADSGKLAIAAAELRGHGAARVETLAADLSTRAGVDALYQAARTLGPVEVFIANAGSGTYGDFTEQTDLDEELEVVALNVASVVQLTKLFARDMVANGGGKIMISSSIMAWLPDAYQTVYAATRAFTYVFAEGLRESLRDRNVQVTVLAPGFTRTSFFEKSGAWRSRAVQGFLMRQGDPAKVASGAYAAIVAGKDHAIPGVFNRLIASAGRIVPDPLIARIVHVMLQPVK